MSYANRKQLDQNRTLSIIFSAVITFVIGFALISGLASSFVKKTAADLKTFDVEQEPPPPEDPPPPQDTPLPPPPQVAAPPPLVRFDTPPVQIQTTPVLNTNPQVTVESKAPVQTTHSCPDGSTIPSQLACKTLSPPKSASGNLQGLIRDDDYPQAAIDADQQGSVTVVLTVGTSGRVTGCSVTGSSGSRALDSTTCRVLQSRAKFAPATDSSGNPATGSFRQTIKWVIAG